MYISMELVEGTSLLDHLNSLAGKGKRMPETDVWQVGVKVRRHLTCWLLPCSSALPPCPPLLPVHRTQVLIAVSLALNYIHVQKKVVHRDLTPSNIVLGQVRGSVASGGCRRRREAA